jgi:hypothetical protein
MFMKLTLALSVACACHAQGVAGQGPVFKLLYSPPVGNIGYLYGIFEGKPGLFYILSTFTGGTTGGSIFTVTNAGNFSPIYSSPQYATVGGVVRSTNGEVYFSGFYGTPPYPSYYFSMDPSGKELQEYPFPGKLGPGFNTVVAPPAAMYDIVGDLQNQVSVSYFARVSESGQVTILHEFTTAEGVPNASILTLGTDGNLYGVGSQSPNGISQMFIYRFTPSGTYSRLVNFPSVPNPIIFPFPLVAAADGTLYGSFAAGGTNNTGEIYQVTLSGQYRIAASLPKNIGSPRTLMQAADGNLYGSTGWNQIYRYEPATGAIKLVYQMDKFGTQGNCGCILIEGLDGSLYGAAPNGGNYPGTGAVFSLDIGLPKPLPSVTGLYPSSGAVGKQVILWGNYLLGATAVSFNGTPATTFKSTSVQSVWATVPAGATSGPVTITTANGSYTTTQSFTVQ